MLNKIIIVLFSFLMATCYKWSPKWRDVKFSNLFVCKCRFYWMHITTSWLPCCNNGIKPQYAKKTGRGEFWRNIQILGCFQLNYPIRRKILKINNYER